MRKTILILLSIFGLSIAHTVSSTTAPQNISPYPVTNNASSDKDNLTSPGSTSVDGSSSTLDESPTPGMPTEPPTQAHSHPDSDYDSSVDSDSDDSQ